MSKYRGYFMRDGRIAAPEVIEAADDAQAMLKAGELLSASQFHCIEVWQEARVVGTLSVPAPPDEKVSRANTQPPVRGGNTSPASLGGTMPHKAWLQSLANMLSAFPEDRVPSKKLMTDIQLVLDEATVIAINHGARLPNFVEESGRLQAIQERLGQARVSELAAQPISHSAVEELVPLIAGLWTDLDRVNRRAAPPQFTAPEDA